MLEIGTVPERLARNRYAVEEESHIEVDQAAVRSAGIGQLLVRILSRLLPGGGRIPGRPARGLPGMRGLHCPWGLPGRSAGTVRRAVPAWHTARGSSHQCERRHAANARELRRDSATRVRVGP
jgi:hypothetical protein